MNWPMWMAALEKWLWQSPYLDVPNYAWLGSGLAALILGLYLLSLRSGAAEKTPVSVSGTPPAAPLPPEPQPGGTSLQTSASPPAEVNTASPSAGEQSETPAPPPPEEKTLPSPPGDSPPPLPLPERAEAEELELLPPEGWFARLKKGLVKTQDKLTSGLARIFSRGPVSPELLEELEELLITSDLGVQTSLKLLERLRTAVKEESLQDGRQVREWLKNEILKILSAVESPLVIPPQEGPFVIMVTGVNGTGKTTTIGKLALRFRQEGKSVFIAAADTFRAAAIQQLAIWGQRANAPVISHQEGADPSAVAFDAIKAAQARGAEVVIIDTAGRLHTKVNLMEELKKIKRITGRELPGAPHEVLLVLDATTGQNALQQAKMFHEALGVTGLVLTKLDGTAKGGIIVAISDEFKIPIRFIGVGEKISDLQPFRAKDFVEAIFGGE